MAGTIGGRAGKSHYAASKAAVDAFTVGFAKEVAREGIRVNAIRPGVVATEMTELALADPASRADIEATIPMGRVGDAAEIARAILWLLSDEAPVHLRRAARRLRRRFRDRPHDDVSALPRTRFGLSLSSQPGRPALRNSPIEIEKLSPAVGAEIRGVDLAQPMAPATFAEIRRAFHEHGVIFFRDQRLTPEQHIDFARRFGEINVNRFFGHVPGYPMIAEVRKEPDQKRNIGEVWHTDHSYDAVPALGSMLLAREVPSVGGDTMFASMIAAYDALSDGLKRTLETLRAEHSSRHVFGPKAGYLGSDLDGRLRQSASSPRRTRCTPW